MTATKKSLRFLTVFALIFAMVLSFASIPASAAGAENWYSSSDYIYENSFTIRGYNLTPVKTCCATGDLNIDLRVEDILDSSTNPMIVTLQVRSSSGAVLISHQSNSSNWIGGVPHGMWVSCPISYGDKVQIYIGAYDAVTGNYRTIKVKYGHMIS